tara:strand:+ start:116 stop:454 length:339 start_codon:yes stop_codon:yes gene_type:complete
MKKLLGIVILGFFLTNCTNYIAEKKRINLQKENAALDKQRQEDKDTCKYYGFKEETSEFSDCLMNLDIARKQELITKKMLECEAVRRDNNQSSATGFWAGVLKGARENLACD